MEVLKAITRGCLFKVLPSFDDHHHCHGVKLTIAQQRFPQSFSLIIGNFSKLQIVVGGHCSTTISKIVERGDPDRLFKNAQHPYTRQLIAASMHV